MSATSESHRSGTARTLYRVGVSITIMLFIGGVAYLLIQAASPTRNSGRSLSSGGAFPPVVVQRLDGGEFDLQRDHGQTTVLFSMAYWCASCALEAQALATLEREFKEEGLVVVAIDIDPSSNQDVLTRFADYAEATNLIYAFDREGEFMRTFEIQQLDTTVILDQGGVEVYRDQQPSSYDMLREAIEGAFGT